MWDDIPTDYSKDGSELRQLVAANAAPGSDPTASDRAARSSHDVREELRRALIDRGLVFGEGYDKMGKTLSWLLDCRVVLLDNRYLSLAANLLWEKLRGYSPDMVGGTTMSAEPLIVAMLYEAAAEGVALQGFVLRKEQKQVGLRKIIEGPPLEPGARVILLDDLVNSGATLKSAIEILEPLGIELLAVGAFVNYERAGAKWLDSIGVPLETVFTLRDLGMVRQLPPSTEKPPPELLWTWEPLNNGEYSAPKSAPCITVDSLYVGSDRGFLVSLGHDGTERWRFEVRDTTRGIHSSPLVVGGRVYFGAYDGYVYCLDASDGSLIWEIRPGSWIGSSPVAHPGSDTIFIGTEYGKAGGSLIAVRGSTGEQVWELKAAGYIHSSPCFDHRHDQVLVGCNDYSVYAADACTGEKRWWFRTGGEIKGRVAVDAIGTCFFGSFDGSLYALDGASGELLWKRKLSHHLYCDPLVYDDVVVVGGYSGRVVALDRDTGSVRWVATTGGRILGGATRLGKDALAIGSADGTVYTLHKDSGETLWQYRTDGPIRTTPAAGASLLVVPSCDGKLYALGLSDVLETNR